MQTEEPNHVKLKKHVTSYFTAFVWFSLFALTSVQNADGAVWVLLWVHFAVFLIGLVIKLLLWKGILRINVRFLTGFMVFSILQAAIDVVLAGCLLSEIPNDCSMFDSESFTVISIPPLSFLYESDAKFALSLVYTLNEMKQLHRCLLTESPDEIITIPREERPKDVQRCISAA